MRTAVKTIAISSFCIASTPALAAAGATGGAQITAHVPAVCDISAQDFVLTESGLVSGLVQEFCNTNTGYQVFASHRPLSFSETATVRYGSQITSLDATGLASVAFRSGQRFEYVPVEIDAKDLITPLAVAFTLSAI
jgi:hypothetical protein